MMPTRYTKPVQAALSSVSGGIATKTGATLTTRTIFTFSRGMLGKPGRLRLPNEALRRPSKPLAPRVPSGYESTGIGVVQFPSVDAGCQMNTPDLQALIELARKHAQNAQFNAGIVVSLNTVMVAMLPGFERDAFDNLLAHLEKTTTLMNQCADQLSQTAPTLPGAGGGDAEYLRWRLTEIMPLFEEARDALPAITESARSLRGIRADLAARMDAAGTRTRAEFDAAMTPQQGG